jgi:hypothetical protein
MNGTSDGYIALGCMARLVGRGHDEDVRRVAHRFLHGEQAAQFRAVLERLR